MSEACTAFLHEHHFEQLNEARSDHEAPSGWYSEAVMSFVFRWYGAQHALGAAFAYKMDLDNPIRSHDRESVARIFQRRTAGIIVNKEQSHWVTFRYYNNHIWLLDSLKRPERYTEAGYTLYLRRYRHAFAVVNEGDLA